MIIGEAILVGIVLSADSFSAAVAMGFRPFTKSQALRFAFSSSFAEILNAMLGIFAGITILKYASAYDHWIAFSLLMGVSLHMAWEGIVGLRQSDSHVDATVTRAHSFKKVLLVSFVTSLDALGVGISLGMAHKPRVLFLSSIGLWAFFATLAGLLVARKLSRIFGPIMSLIGAAILFAMSFQLLKI